MRTRTISFMMEVVSGAISFTMEVSGTLYKQVIGLEMVGKGEDEHEKLRHDLFHLM